MTTTVDPRQARAGKQPQPGTCTDTNGNHAPNFKENFVDKFESITQNQSLLTGVVKGALQAQQSIWTGVRKDIVDIADIADITLAGIEHCDDCGKNDWTMAFAVAGAVISIAAVPVTGGASLAPAAVGGAVAVGCTAIGNSDEASGEGYSGESAEVAVESMRRAITSLKGHITGAETEIQTAMNDTIGVVNANRDLFVAAPPQPRRCQRAQRQGRLRRAALRPPDQRGPP